MEFVSRLTEQEVTPATFDTAFSTRALQAAMLENDAYCPDILIQVSAINAALNSFNRLLLANHIRTCVADDIRDGKPDTIDEFVTMLQKLMR